MLFLAKRLTACLLFFCVTTAWAEPPRVVIRVVEKSGMHMYIKAMGILDLHNNVHVRGFEAQLDPNEKTIIALRDPRDIFFSWVHWLDYLVEWSEKSQRAWPGPYKHPSTYGKWKNLTADEKLSAVLTASSLLPIEEKHIREQFSRVGKYLSDPEFIVVYFHNTIGSRGGGDDLLQWNEFHKITDFISQYIPHIQISDARLRNCLDHLWGGTRSFSNNQKLGIWKRVYNEEHICLFKEHWNEYLVAWGYEKDCNW